MRINPKGALLLAAVAMLALSASTAQDYRQADESSAIADSLSFYADLVKETELRRRVNVLFPNPQSILDGLQVGYVGVRHGNLTFRRRDIVSGLGKRVYFSRAYDSRIGQNRDFGPGWRLSLAEELTAVNGDLVYTDGSGARHVFKLVSPNERGDRNEPFVSGQPVDMATDGSALPFFRHIASGTYAVYPETPRHAATAIEIIGPLAVLRDGPVTRVFEREYGGSSVYLLSTIASAGETLALSYRNGRVNMVSGSAGVVFEITRDRLGRIVSVQDRWGRSVHYGYDASGRLTETLDLAGHAWRYEYGSHGLLTRMIGPNDKDVLRISYDASGRVIQSHSGREYSFAYAHDETVVTEGIGHVHVFGHDATGITDRFDSTNGDWWRLNLDGRNRVTTLQSSMGEHRFGYGSEGEITDVAEITTDGIVSQAYEHDGEGRIVSISSQDGALTEVDYGGGKTRITGPAEQIGFEVLSSGRIAQVEQDGALIRTDYDGEGNLTAFHSGERTVQFSHDVMGRISGTQYPNGVANRYQYDALGNRSSIDYGSGGAVRYTHDATGNIVEVVVTERNGEANRQVVQIGDMNRVEKITYQGMGALDIAYDGMGRAISFNAGRDVISVEYAGPGRIGSIVSQATSATWSPNDQVVNAGASRQVSDARRELLQSDSTGSSHPDYGVVAFDGISFEAEVLDPLDAGVPGLSEARRVFAVAEPLFSSNEQGALMEFEKPSNTVFQPLEYRSTNCCICIIIFPQSVRPNYDEGTPICICSPAPSPPARASVGVNPTQVRPLETGDPNRATITVSTANVSPGTDVSIELESLNDGGHVGHSGNRPLGTVTPEGGEIDSQGRFQAEFKASEFGGDVRVVATVGKLKRRTSIEVRVPDLSQMPAGDGYFFTGSSAGRTTHPTGEYATATVKNKLKTIAKTYKDKYWSDSTPQPNNKRVGYNDMSLIYGGKFDLPANWCTECSHRGHREGTHVDARRWNMTSTQQKVFKGIVEDNGGDPQVHDAGTTNEHWHLEF